MPDGSLLYLSPGQDNVPQMGIVQELGPRFALGAVVLCVGDTAQKHVVHDEK
jgi:type II restriction enzyme